MRPITSLSAALMLAAVAAPALASQEEPRIQIAQAGPPSSGWGAPAAPAPAQAAPPGGGWAAPAAPQAAPAAAPSQSGWGPPSAGPAMSMPGAMPGAGGPRRNCMGEIQPLLAEAEKSGKAIKPAAATKKQPVVCQAFRNLANAEGKLLKYFEDHGVECGVPPDAVKARKSNYAKIVEFRTKICDAASAPAPRAPSLSDALGTSSVPSVSSNTGTGTARRGSTFDTLTGNPLAR